MFALFLLLSVVSSTHAQSALDGFDPNADGAIQIVLVQPDGKILLGGSFSTLSPNGGPPITRNRIARLNPDGTVDMAFNPNASSFVNAIALQADGKVLVGGDFTSIGGQPRNRLARLDPTTGLADSFDPNANDTVWSVAVQTDGKILVGGAFGTVGGQARSHIARLDATTGQPDGFDPSANSHIYSMIEEPGGKILVSGSFTSIAGQNRNRIARLNADTGEADPFDPNVSNTIFSMARQADGKILVGGAFSTVGDQLRNRIARIDSITGQPDGFDPNANNAVTTIAVQTDGKILVGGPFAGAASIGGQARNHIARLDPISGLADSFDPNADDTVWSIAVQSDGKVLAGGSFMGENAIAGKTRNAIARLERDGSLDQTLDLTIVTTNPGPPVYATAMQPDGKVLISGTFASVAGMPRRGIARLNQDGTLDMTFDPAANGLVGSIVVQSDGKILVGGQFTSIGGQARKSIARIDAVTGLADSFDPNANLYAQVQTIVAQPDGKLLIGGSFQSVGGQSRSNIARVDPVTGLADSFNPIANNEVHTITIAADGKILVGGMFTNIGGAARSRIARLDSVTGLVDSFDPGSDSSQINSIIVEENGKILVGGIFMSIGGQTRWAIARLDATTGLADSFDPHSAGAILSMSKQADGNILASGFFTSVSGQQRNRIARIDPVTGLPDSWDPNAISFPVMFASSQPDGKILAGGYFTGIGGQPRTHLARLSNDTAALRNLEVTQTNVTWKLLGSSPHCIRVAFETSSDNVNYVPLGNGTSSGNDWTLAGLSLPSATNFYVRARGFYRTGTQSGSESIMESVRNVFLPGLTPTPILVPPVPEVTPPTTKCLHCVRPHR